MHYIYPDLLLISKEYLTLHLQGLKWTNTLNGVNKTNLKVEKGQKSKNPKKSLKLRAAKNHDTQMLNFFLWFWLILLVTFKVGLVLLGIGFLVVSCFGIEHSFQLLLIVWQLWFLLHLHSSVIPLLVILYTLFHC